MFEPLRALIGASSVGFARRAGLVVTAVLAACVAFAAPVSAYIYWTGSGSIGRANLDGSRVNDAFFPFQQGYGTAANDTHLYWGGVLGNTVSRVDVDGGNPKPQFITGASGIFQMAIDAQYIYWTNGYANTIGRARLDGTDVNQSFIVADVPSGIAVDAGHLYWTSGTVIGRANLDGTGVNPDFIAVPGGRRGVGRIATDGNHIYWTNPDASAIGRVDADGTNVNASFITGSIGYAIAVHNQHLYWGAGNAISRAELDGTGIQRTFVQAGQSMDGIAFNTLTSAPTTTSLAPSAASSFYGDLSLTFAAHVTSPPGTPVARGTVQFQVNGIDDGAPVALDAQARAVYDSTFFLDVGDKVTARYSGDALHDPSGAEVDPQIRSAHTAITLASSNNPLRAGDQVTFSAKVRNTSTALTPFGSVQFVVDGAPILDPLEIDDDGEVAIIGGKDLPPGDHVVQALYRDDTEAIPDFAASQASLSQRIESTPINQSPPAVASFTPAPVSPRAVAPTNRFSLVRATAGRSGTITMLVSAPEAGTFTASAVVRSPLKARSAVTSRDRSLGEIFGATTTPYGVGKAVASGPGRLRVVIKANTRARRALATGKTLRVKASVSFRPKRGGPSQTTATAITVKGKRK